MNAKEFVELVVATPFKPFKVYLSDGSSYEVDHQWQVATTPHRPFFVYLDDEAEGGPLHSVSYRNITRIEVAGVESTS